ncbi:MAG: hypothetical protein APF80_13840 [Alphaproteobacteria bacterium BRH_c36]|nr:MAG: hypothetical protein APF80_13840 [Alphaproteobacteria bacterium BRH_c36]
MRLLKCALVAASLVAAMAVAAPPAEAGGLWRDRGERVVTHRVYRPRYRDVYIYGDPYAYRYMPRGYYPYYNSGYWVPSHVIRKRRYLRPPPYYKAWGENRRGYRHRQWHYRHHGGHRHGHW